MENVKRIYRMKIILAILNNDYKSLKKNTKILENIIMTEKHFR